VARATGVPPTLDDVFLALTGRTLREAGEGEPTEEEADASAEPARRSSVAEGDASRSPDPTTVASTEGAQR
jgi:ABC-2 type transport system ATP-binding protein